MQKIKQNGAFCIIAKTTQPPCLCGGQCFFLLPSGAAFGSGSARSSLPPYLFCGVVPAAVPPVALPCLRCERSAAAKSSGGWVFSYRSALSCPIISQSCRFVKRSERGGVLPRFAGGLPCKVASLRFLLLPSRRACKSQSWRQKHVARPPALLSRRAP